MAVSMLIKNNSKLIGKDRFLCCFAHDISPIEFKRYLKNKKKVKNVKSVKIEFFESDMCKYSEKDYVEALFS